MTSFPSDSFNMRVTEDGNLHLEDTERSQWILNSPTPPPLWKKLITPLKNNKLFSSSKNKKTCHENAFSFFSSLFPILGLFKNYDAFKFKDDFLAGLTLASLSIPQVYIYTYIHKHYFFIFN
jgi:low affinity sulfate transporter 2